MEEWRAVKGYEGLYEVSNIGRVRSLKRATTNGKILKQCVNKYGYLELVLCKNNVKKKVRVHRLVAEAFLSNPNNLPVVNHKDECKQNNTVENLEWCTVAYNTGYNNGCFKRAAKRKIKVVAVKGEEQMVFDSIQECANHLGVAHYNISSCLHNRHGRKTLKGYQFRYLEKENEHEQSNYDGKIN